jgi:hypothetical protein
MLHECYQNKKTMPELNNIQSDFLTQRETIAAKEKELQVAKAKLQQLNSNVVESTKGLSANDRQEKLNLIQQEQDKLQAEIGKHRNDFKAQREKINKLKLDAFANLNPIESTSKLSDDYPILLFPLRLETRFKNNAAQKQLWLRVYPDDCNVTKSEKNITKEELANTKTFWIEFWKALGDEEMERGAWRSLVSSYGVGRATWLIHHYNPVSTRADVEATIKKVLIVFSSIVLTSDEEKAINAYWISYWLAKGDAQLISAADTKLLSDLNNDATRTNEIKEKYIPTNLLDTVSDDLTINTVKVVTLDVRLKDGISEVMNSWNEAPRATALPDKFVAIAYTGATKRTIIFNHPVKDFLAVGIDPLLEGDDQIKKDEINKDIEFNEDLKWMIDFDKAVEVGMGVKINLSAQEATAGFDKLFVVGLRFSTNEKTSADTLEQLIDDHFYSKQGFGLIKQGTPTNNTEDNPSGYSSTDDPEESYDRLFKESEVFTEANDYWLQPDGQRLANSLGVKSDIFQNKTNASGKDQLEAYAMNTAMFPATMGYFMDEMMDPLFSDRTIHSTKFFFSRFVSGRGSIPAIKIGKQPYGILPVSVYSKLSFYENRDAIFSELGDTKNPYLNKVQSLIKKLDATWDTLLPQASFIGKAGDSHQMLLDVLGLHPNSVEFHQRYAQTIKQLYNQILLESGFLVALIVAWVMSERGKVIMKEFGLDPDIFKLPILDKYFLSEPNILKGPLVDDVPESETDIIRAYTSDDKNYLHWLAYSDGDTIRLQNFGTGKRAPNALLYMMLRHSLMLSQSKSATNLLITKRVIADKRTYFDQDFMHIQKTDERKSKFEHLYNPAPTVTDDSTKLLIEHIYKPSILFEAVETKELRETIAALKLLENTPTARLERLFIEHLDCCNYRLDAWKTGLVSYKLLEQQHARKRENKPDGLYLGAYGWLENVRPKTTSNTAKQLPPDLSKIFNPKNDKIIVTDSANLGHIHAPSIDQAATAAILRNAYQSNKGSGTANPFAINLNSERVRLANLFLEGMRNGQTLNALLGYQFERGLHDKYNLGLGEADIFIYPLRKAFPLSANSLKSTVTTATDVTDAVTSNNMDEDKAIETIEANNVIDGLKLIEHVQKSATKTYPFGLPASYKLPPANATQQKAINDEVQRIMEINDAISDMVMAEQVYQVVKGNFERTSGVAEAFSKGSYPPEMEVVKTERSGINLTNRIAIHFNAEADSNTSPNTVANMTPRAKLEPSINEWLSNLLPSPDKVLCKISYSKPGAQNQEEKVSQQQLGLQSIDLLFSSHFDSEQAMAELDDRIAHYVRYNISNHPDTTLTINYTDSIDVNDVTKISFFELGALLKSLRIILNATKYLKPDALGVPTGESLDVETIDINHLTTKLSTLTGELTTLKNTIQTKSNSIVSIASLKTLLKTEVTPHFADTSKQDALTTQLEADIKSFLTNPTVNNKTDILTAFESSIATIADATVKTNLKTEYGNKLELYKSEFGNLDTLVKDVSDLFISAADYDNNQTGTGFIHQAIGEVYTTTFDTLAKVITRWEKKKTDYETLIATHDPTGQEDEQYTLLQKAERLIAPRSTFPLPPVLADYKLTLDGKKGLFDAALGNLKLLKTNSKNAVTEFVKDVELVITAIPTFDIIPFDSENNYKDLYAQKIKLIALYESVALAVKNEAAYLETKLIAYQTVLASITSNLSNTEQADLYLSAAKTILGDDMLLIPHFTLSSSKATEVENVYAAKESILNFIKGKGVALPVDDWFGGVARVREKSHEWENISFLSTAFNTNASSELTPLQFPYTKDDRWAAVEYKNVGEKYVLNGDKLLYTAHFAKAFDKTKPVCGIVVDEWTEVIPSDKETTGIAFHYDQPNSEPPQTMLLVTPPVFKGEWDWETIVLSLEETLSMAKKRAIEPSQVEGTTYSQFLPTTITAVTSHLITVAMNYAQTNIPMTKTN